MHQALILAAGQGSRLGLKTHKGLALISKKQSMLGRIIEQLSELQFNIALVVGYQHEELIREFNKKLTIIHNPWFRTRNSLYSLWLGAQRLSDEQVLTGYCDAMVDDGILRVLANTKPETAIVVPGYDGRGIRPRVERDTITRVEAAGEPDPNGVTFSGFMMRSRASLLKLVTLPGFHTKGASHSLIGCNALTVDSWAINVNTPEDLEQAKEKICKR